MSHFAKRHYETIALMMQDTYNFSGVDKGTWGYVVDKLADTFARDDDEFKRERFIRACQPGANVRARS